MNYRVLLILFIQNNVVVSSMVPFVKYKGNIVAHDLASHTRRFKHLEIWIEDHPL